jgi:hypothetical protein
MSTGRKGVSSCAQPLQASVAVVSDHLPYLSALASGGRHVLHSTGVVPFNRCAEDSGTLQGGPGKLMTLSL